MVITDIVEAVIDRLQYSKTDLLKVSLISKIWLPRSRYHLMERFLPSSLDLGSSEVLLQFAQLVSSQHCTLISPEKRLESLTIDSRPFPTGPLRPDIVELLGDGLGSFMERTTVNNILSIELDNMALNPLQCSPFPWPTIARWKHLSHITIAATLPSLAVLTIAIEESDNLDTAELDVDYVDSSVPALRVTSLPRSFRNLTLGPRGQSFFSWLAQFPEGAVDLFTLIVFIEKGDASPFAEFASSGAHDGIDWLEIVFREDRVADFAPCLPFFTWVTEMTIALHFSRRTRTTYQERIQTILEALDPVTELSLRFTIPSELIIPWALTSRAPGGMDADELRRGEAKWRNHMQLASLDKEQIKELTELAIRYVDERWNYVENERLVYICISADRGAICCG